jgi:hypothetical protein
MDSADVGVVQCGGGFRLPLKTCKRLGVFGHILGQKLQRNKAIEFDVLGFVHNAHPAAPELFEDAVVRNGLADK